MKLASLNGDGATKEEDDLPPIGDFQMELPPVGDFELHESHPNPAAVSSDEVPGPPEALRAGDEQEVDR